MAGGSQVLHTQRATGTNASPRRFVRAAITRQVNAQSYIVLLNPNATTSVNANTGRYPRGRQETTEI